MSETLSLSTLADRVNAWCEEHAVEPVSSQAGTTVSERNIRFYRTIGLVDAPEGGPRGYGEKHLLQLAAIRLLQAKGLPLRKIRELLYGRSLEELREIRRRGLQEKPRPEAIPPLLPATAEEVWRMIPLTEDFVLCSRRGAALTARQRAAVLRALGARDTAESSQPTAQHA